AWAHDMLSAAWRNPRFGGLLPESWIVSCALYSSNGNCWIVNSPSRGFASRKSSATLAHVSRSFGSLDQVVIVTSMGASAFCSSDTPAEHAASSLADARTAVPSINHHLLMCLIF